MFATESDDITMKTPVSVSTWGVHVGHPQAVSLFPGIVSQAYLFPWQPLYLGTGTQAVPNVHWLKQK